MEQVYKLWKMKITSSSGIFTTIYHNDSYLLLFGKRKLHSLKSQRGNSWIQLAKGFCKHQR